MRTGIMGISCFRAASISRRTQSLGASKRRCPAGGRRPSRVTRSALAGDLARLHTGATGGWLALAVRAPGADRCGAQPVRWAAGTAHAQTLTPSPSARCVPTAPPTSVSRQSPLGSSRTSVATRRSSSRTGTSPGVDQFWPGPDGFRSLQLVIELSQPLRSPRCQPGTKAQLCHGDEGDQCRPALDERLIRLSEWPRPAG